MVQFCCDKGYTLSGVSMATCNQDTGEWEPQTPDCLRKKSYNSFGSLIYYFWEMSEFLHCLNSLLPRQCTTISVLGLVMFNIPLKSTFLQVKVECTLTLGSQNKAPISGQISKYNIPLNSNPFSQSLRRG